jgi:hypothetical protein
MTNNITTLVQQAILSSGGINLFAFTANQRQWYCDLVSDGDLPTKDFAIAPGINPGYVTVIEHFLPEAYLSAALEQFNSQYHLGDGKY